MGTGALLCPSKIFAGTVLGQAGADASSEAAFDQEAFALWSNRLVGSALSTKGARPQPDEAAFFYYTRDKGFLRVEFDIDGQTDLGKMLPNTSTNMKLAVDVVRPNRDHLDYIKRNANGTLGISIMPFADTPPAKAASSGNDNSKVGTPGGSNSSDHLISSVVPPPPPFDYHVSYPSGDSLVTSGAPMHTGFGNWAWTFTVQEKAPKWQSFMTELQGVVGSQSSAGNNQGNKAQSGSKSQATSTTNLSQAVKFLQGGIGAWETLSVLGIGLGVFNNIIAKTMAKNGKPQVLLTLPNYQIITSKAGRAAATGSALPLLAGDYVAVPMKKADMLENAGTAYELYEGVIVPAGSKDMDSALKETLMPATGQPDDGLTYVSFSVKFS